MGATASVKALSTSGHPASTVPLKGVWDGERAEGLLGKGHVVCSGVQGKALSSVDLSKLRVPERELPGPLPLGVRHLL